MHDINSRVGTTFRVQNRLMNFNIKKMQSSMIWFQSLHWNLSLKKLLGCKTIRLARKFFQVFHKVVWMNPNKLLGQPNTTCRVLVWEQIIISKGYEHIPLFPTTNLCDTDRLHISLQLKQPISWLNKAADVRNHLFH